MLSLSTQEKLAWQKNNGLLPVIVQHALSGEVLMLGYMNEEALKETEKSGKVTFFSRSKNRLWVKGETTGHFLNVVSLTSDCDLDTILCLAMPEGPTCHTGASSCFSPTVPLYAFLYQLEGILAARKKADPTRSYTAKLYQQGTKRIAQKVGEEGVETALAAMARDPEELTNESADLLYHLMVLLQDQNLNLAAVLRRLNERHAAG